jgi:NAD(P)-dependent dehydrogenase (short-subunit alcohol dehydrogenase family)
MWCDILVLKYSPWCSPLSADILINNAGVNMATGATVEISLDKVRATFETNVSGVWGGICASKS